MQNINDHIFSQIHWTTFSITIFCVCVHLQPNWDFEVDNTRGNAGTDAKHVFFEEMEFLLFTRVQGRIPTWRLVKYGAALWMVQHMVESANSTITIVKNQWLIFQVQYEWGVGNPFWQKAPLPQDLLLKLADGGSNLSLSKSTRIFNHIIPDGISSADKM